MDRIFGPQIVSAPIRRFWDFVPRRIRDGPANGFPLTITATPEIVPSI